MKNLLLLTILTIIFTACVPFGVSQPLSFGMGYGATQPFGGVGMNGRGLPMAGPAGIVAAQTFGAGGFGTGGMLMPPAGAGQSIYANTAYDPATHATIAAQNPPTYLVGGSGVSIGAPSVSAGAPPSSGQTAAASRRDVRALRAGVRVLMQQQVAQGRRIGALERPR